MKFLTDTNIFIHTINNNIYQVADLCKRNETDICITETIMNELKGYCLSNEDEEIKGIYIGVDNLSKEGSFFKVIEIIDINKDDKAKKLLTRIRDNYYGWMKNPQYVKTMIEAEIITKEEAKDIKKYLKKDLGECELVAIAVANKGKYIIVTNDEGRVFKKPHHNIFKTYAQDIQIINGNEWLKKIGL